MLHGHDSYKIFPIGNMFLLPRKRTRTLYPCSLFTLSSPHSFGIVERRTA
jgi:hypothetical protein